jgi:hypothetical protein
MTDDRRPLDRITGEETRRSFMKKSAVATAGVGTLASGIGVAQEDEPGEGWKALIFANNFQPQARFAIVSGVVTWTPNYGEIQDNWFSSYNTRMIRWQNTGEKVPLFVAQDAGIGEVDQNLGFITDVDDDPNQPQLFEMNREWTVFGDSPKLITVNASPVPEDEEDRILQDEDWWRAGGSQGATNTTTTDGNQTVTNTTTTNDDS